MNKAKLEEALQKGHKMTHTTFLKGEWIKLNGKLIEFEDSVTCTVKEFWKNRPDPIFRTGWSIFQENQ